MFLVLGSALSSECQVHTKSPSLWSGCFVLFSSLLELQFLLWTQEAYLKNVLETSLDESFVPVKSFPGSLVCFFNITFIKKFPVVSGLPT